MSLSQPPVVLITRPEESAGGLKGALEAKGYATMVEPMLTIEPLGQMSSLLEDVQALIITSRNAVPALNAEARQRRIFAVGRATAEAARSAGCRFVISGDGDGAELADLIGRQCQPDDGALLHLSGDVVREDMQLSLVHKGFDVRREVVYRALPRAAFSDVLVGAWHNREIAAVLLFSPKTAENLVRLVIEHGLAAHVDRTTAICVSEATAKPCRVLDWRNLHLAARPNQAELIRALEGSIGIC